MKLLCPNCQTPIPARNVNVQTMTAVCEACDSVFQFEPSALVGQVKRHKQAKPTHFTVRQGDTWSVEYVWRKGWGALEWSIAILTTFGGLMTTPMALKFLSEFRAEGEPMQLVLTGIIGLIMLACWYIPATMVVNRTRITLDADRLTIQHMPLPWQGLNLPLDQIDHFQLEPVEIFPEYSTLKVVMIDGTSHNIDSARTSYLQYLKRQFEQQILDPDATAEPLFVEVPDAARLRLSADGELIPADEVTDPASDEPAHFTHD